MSARLNELLVHTLGGLVEIRWDGMARGWNAFADETQLELALMNLIINARDAMPEGGTITITAENHHVREGGALALAPGDYVVLRVGDTGEGIAPALLEQVMEPFFTTKPVGKGTGLGLSMVYGFARQSGGAVQIESEVGQGTQVAIWLPRAPGRTSNGIRNAEEAADQVQTQPLRILLVDDHEGVRAMTAAMLSELGHQVSAVRDSAWVVRQIQSGETDWDLLITDYAMPAMSGSELLRRVREHTPQLPGLIITGYADPDSIGSKPDDVQVLVKPFTIEQLRTAIGQCAGPGC
jgi:CheY-like chemotaxis protein